MGARTQMAALCLVLLLAGGAQANDSLNVRRVGQCATPGEAVDVAVSDTLVYVTDRQYGLRVISVSDPANPQDVGHFDTLRSAQGVALSDDYVYVASLRGLRVISVSDPANPREVGRCDTLLHAYDVVCSGGYAYVAAWDSGLRVVSIADPANPVEVGHCDIPGRGHGVSVKGQYVFVAAYDSGLRVISVVDPSHPEEVGVCAIPWGQNTGVAVSGNYAYVAAGLEGLRVVSISDPTHPVEVGNCTGRALGVAVDSGYAYVAGYRDGLRVISIADPAHPVEVGHYKMSSWANAAAVCGGYVYVAYGLSGLQVFQYYPGVGDLDVDTDSLAVMDDTIQLGRSGSYALGAFVLGNTSSSFNPDTTDGPSMSPVDSISFTGSLAGPGGKLDSLFVRNLPESLAQGQTVTCTLAAYVPPGLRFGSYTGAITFAGRDTWHYQVVETVYARLAMLGDLDIDPDSLDAVADTVRVRPRQLSAGPPPEFSKYALGLFILANTDSSYNPDSSDGPSQSPIDSLRATGFLSGPGGTIDSVFILNPPASLAMGRTIVCTLAAYVPPGFRDGDYSGSIRIAGTDTAGFEVEDSFYAIVGKLGDLDVARDSLGVVNDTIDLHAQPAGPVYSPYAKAPFMLVNTGSAYNPDTEDGPSRSTLIEFEVEARAEGQNGSTDSVYVLNLPESLAVGQAMECTLALVIPVGTPLSGYTGMVTISAYDSLGYQVQDSFFLVVHGPQPRQNLDSLRVAPVPFKPNQNPEHDAIHFQGLSAGARVTVYDASGQSVWSDVEKGDGHLEWNASVASGIYVYLVVSADGKSSKVGKLSVIR
jgi:hypothetical protein